MKRNQVKNKKINIYKYNECIKKRLKEHQNEGETKYVLSPGLLLEITVHHYQRHITDLAVVSHQILTAS